ncbi:hypothetical protein [Streptomyces xantholiticus]|nr:hypothetical protein [Streptomyces xantholiticus]
MTRRRFAVLLVGLSDAAVFRRVAEHELSIIDDPGQISSALQG